MQPELWMGCARREKQTRSFLASWPAPVTKGEDVPSSLMQAKQLVMDMGYGRREAEVAALEALVKG